MGKKFGLSLFYLLIFICLSSVLVAQENNKSFTKALSISNDNDFYLLSGSDRYYTNGITINYAQLKPSTSSSTGKTVFIYELGQHIFNAYKRKIEPEKIQEIDRPIAGYLYLSFSKYQYRSVNQMWYWKITPGIVGPAALGQEVQSGWHSIIGIQTKWDWIWKYQIKNTLGIDLSSGYSINLLKSNSAIQISTISEATIGSLHTNLSQSMLFQLGRPLSISHSNFWHSNYEVSDSRFNKLEIFLFYHPNVSYKLFDATLQGGLFNHSKDSITSRPIPFQFQNTLGFFASLGRLNATIKLVAQTKDARTQFNSHLYGGIAFGYLIK